MTRGLIDGKVRIYERGDILAAYAVCIYCLATFHAVLVLKDPGYIDYVLVMSALVYSLLGLSFASGRRKAKEYIVQHGNELTE